MVYDGTTTVATAGTPVPLLSVPTKADWVTIWPLSTNGGTIYIGGSTVLAATPRGAPLNVGDSLVLWPFATGAHGAYDLNAIKMDSTTSGDKVTFIYGRS